MKSNTPSWCIAVALALTGCVSEGNETATTGEVAVDLFVDLVAQIAEAGTDVVRGVRGLVLKALIAVGAAHLLLGLVLRLSIGALRVIHQVGTSFGPRDAGLLGTYGATCCDPSGRGRRPDISALAWTVGDRAVPAPGERYGVVEP